MSVWLKSFVGYMLIVSIAIQMLPNEKYEQYVRLFAGFLLIVLVLQPILKIGSADSLLENKIAQLIQEQEAMEEEIGKQTELFRADSEKMQENDQEKIQVREIEKVRVEVSVDD